jgi:hypothetical protein
MAGFDIAPYGEAIAEGSKLLNKLLGRVLPAEKMSEAVRLKLSQELTLAMMQNDAQQVLAQLAINKAEAEHDSIFVAGWRPFVGCVCGSAFAYTFVLQPLAVFIVVTTKWAAPPLPSLDMAPMLTVLGGLLGLGAMRSYEKVKGESTTATKVGA